MTKDMEEYEASERRRDRLIGMCEDLWGKLQPGVDAGDKDAISKAIDLVGIWERCLFGK